MRDLSRRTFMLGGAASLAVTTVEGMQEIQRKGISTLIDGSGLVHIKAGEFVMGSQDGNPDEQPMHRVRISHGFEMGRFEVTQAQWDDVMRDAHTRPDTRVNPSHFAGANRPVEFVSWDEVDVFFKRLNGQDDRYAYRLPTEAEWEYACRAGTKGDHPGDIERVAWYKENSGEETQEVGKKEPNAWGLYDMLGNVAEWVRDWYGRDSYALDARTDPSGPDSGSYRVFRGGCWFDPAKYCRPAYRGFDFPSSQFYNVGFRVVRTKLGAG